MGLVLLLPPFPPQNSWRVSFGKCRSNHVSFLFNTFQWLLMLLRIKSHIFAKPSEIYGLPSSSDVSPSCPPSHHSLQPQQRCSYAKGKYSFSFRSLHSEQNNKLREAKMHRVMPLRSNGAGIQNQVSQPTRSVFFIQPHCINA